MVSRVLRCFITKFLGTVTHQFIRVGSVLGNMEEVNTFSDRRKFLTPNPWSNRLLLMNCASKSCASKTKALNIYLDL